MGANISNSFTEKVQEVWGEFDPANQGKIPRNALPSLLDKLMHKTQLPANKNQILSIVDSELREEFIEKQDLEKLIDSKKSQSIQRIDLEAIKKQVEYYFSDSNLRRDKFFQELISQNSEGYVPVDAIMRCRRIRNLNASAPMLVESLQSSSEVELNSEKTGIRRVDNRPPPPLQQSQKPKKEEKLPESTTIVFKVTVPEETKCTWKDLRDTFRAKYIDTDIVYVRFAGTEGHIGISGETPAEKVEAITQGGLELDSQKVPIVKLEGDELLDFWKQHGSHFDLCSNSAKKNKRTKKEGINMGGKYFSSVSKLRSYLKSLLNATPEGQNVDPQYHNCLQAVLKLHPNYESKAANMKTFYVDKHPEHTESKCFFVVKQDNSKEDFSIVKCLAQL